jgi:tetratricopeptide (TPR) repeat protein
VLPDLPRWSSRPTRIYAFRDRDSLEPFLPASTARVAGYFRKGSAENFIVLDLEGGTPAFESVLFHEYVHLVMSLSERGLPLWLEEGLSEFYAAARLDERSAEIGVSIPRHRSLLARAPLMPFEKLVASEEPSELFYAQSWALVHYLVVEAPRGRERLARYLALVRKRGDALSAFRDAGLDDALSEYVRRPRWGAIQVGVTPQPSGAIVPRRLTMAEVQERWGELFLATSKLPEARVCLEEAARLDPALSSAWEALGFLDLESGDSSRARAHLKRAIELGSASASGLYRYAEILLADHRGRIDAIPPDIADEATSVLRRSVALAPSERSPAELLAFVYLVRGERLDEADALVRATLEAFPEDPSLLFLQGQLLAKRGSYDRARDVLGRAAEATEDPRLREEVEEFLARVSHLERAPGR